MVEKCIACTGMWKTANVIKEYCCFIFIYKALFKYIFIYKYKATVFFYEVGGLLEVFFRNLGRDSRHDIMT